MMREGIDFLDGNYELVRKEKNARQIRTKSSSFAGIKKNFTDFRIKLLNKKLEREKEKALTDAYSGQMTQKDEDKIMKRATNIARLEEKIMFLSKENVPSDYIDKRAIKIKKAMMENISYTAANVYSVGLENEDVVFADTVINEDVVVEEFVSDVQEQIAEDVSKIMDEEPVVEEKNSNYVPDAVTRAEIKAEVDKAFEEVVINDNSEDITEEHIGEELPNINLDDIKASIDEAFEQMAMSETEATIGPEDIQSVVDESIESVSSDEKISLEDIEVEIDEAIEQIVSKNGSASAKLDRFNDDGTRKEKYTYTPMTDEEIKAAQANIEYEKYEQIYKMEHQNAIKFQTAKFEDIFKPAEGNFEGMEFYTKVEEDVREVPIIVPVVDEERFVSEKHEVNEVSHVVSKPTSLEEFSELKAKVEELKKKLAESESRKNTAIQFAARTADRAEEMKKITIASEKEYQERLISLQLLAKTLEENCNLNDTAARTARIDAECNERFISSQMTKKSQFDEAINQVDSILGFTNSEEHGRGRRAA